MPVLFMNEYRRQRLKNNVGGTLSDEVGVIMRVQVFKKTLLSMAVVTVLGGGFGLAHSAPMAMPMPIQSNVLDNGINASFINSVNTQIGTLSQTNNPLSKQLLGKFAGEIRTLQVELAALNKTVSDKQVLLNTANTNLQNATGKNKIAMQALVSTADKELTTAKTAVTDKNEKFLKDISSQLNKDAGVSLFAMVSPGSQTASGQTVSGVANVNQMTRLKPLVDAVVVSPVTKATKGLDGEPLGAKDPVTSANENAVIAAINKLDNDKDIKPLFMTGATTVTPAGRVYSASSTTTWVPLPSVKISNLDLTNANVTSALLAKVKAATVVTTPPGRLGSVIESDSTKGVTFQSAQLELENVHNTFMGPSVIPDVSSAVGKAQDPTGSYVLSGNGSLYHKAVGGGQALKSITVEGQQLKVQGKVSAQHVAIGNGGSLLGYSVDNQQEKAGYAELVGTLPANVQVMNAQNVVIGREATSLVVNSDAPKQQFTPKGFETISFSGNKWHAEQVGYDAAGAPSARDVNIEKGQLILKAGAEGLAGQNITISKDASVVATNEVPDPNNPQQMLVRDVQAVIEGTNLAPQEQETTTDGGKTWTGTGKMVVPEKSVSIAGKAIATIRNMDHLTVNGTLITDSVGSDTDRIKSFTMGKGASVIAYSDKANTIYGTGDVEYMVGEDQTIINDLDGFKSFALTGGMFEGDLTGTAAAQNAVNNKGAFQGSTVHLTKGVYQGGTIKGVQSIVIDGPVTLKPSQTQLSAYGTNNNLVSTKLNAVTFNSPVTITASGLPMIEKIGTTTAGQSTTPTLATPVLANQGLVMEKGAILPVTLNIDASEADRSVALLKVDNTLKLNDNVVRATLGKNGKSRYAVSRESYEKRKKNKDEAMNFLIVDADKIEGKFAEPKADDIFLSVSGVQSTSANGREAYSLNVKHHDITQLKAITGYDDWEIKVLNAYGAAAFSTADPVVGEAIYNEMTSAYRSNSSNELVPTGILSGGLAQTAMTTHRKVNESIDRRLERTRTGMSSGDMFESQGFWGQYFYNDGKMDNKGHISGFDSKVNGITLGVDADVNDALTAGFAFSYANSKLTHKKASGETKTDTYMGTVYGGWNEGPYFVDGMMSYAGGRNDIQRAKYKGDGVKSSVWGARIVGGYAHQINQWTLQPQAELGYSSFKLDEFTEKGEPGNQQVKMKDFDVMELGGGLKVFGEFDAGRGVIKPEASLMAYHDFKDDKPEGSFKLVQGADSAWTPIPANDREQNRYALGFGASYAMDNNLSLGLNYDYNWSGDFKAHSFMARVSYEF